MLLERITTEKDESSPRPRSSTSPTSSHYEGLLPSEKTQLSQSGSDAMKTRQVIFALDESSIVFNEDYEDIEEEDEEAAPMSAEELMLRGVEAYEADEAIAEGAPAGAELTLRASPSAIGRRRCEALRR